MGTRDCPGKSAKVGETVGYFVGDREDPCAGTRDVPGVGAHVEENLG